MSDESTSRRTLDPSSLHLKTREQAVGTIREMFSLDRGFLGSPRWFYLLYALLLVSWVTGILWLAIAIGLVLLYDWLAFRAKRRQALARYEAHPLRMRTAADAEVVETLYTTQGREQPSMSDWVAAAGEAAGVAPTGGGHSAHASEDERYLEIARVVKATEPPPRWIADVGANDGVACHRYGIGADVRFLGLDISLQLLRRFREHLPGQPAVVADAASLPVADGALDFVYATETIEHLEDPVAVLGECARTLRPGGTLLIQSPNAHRLRNLNLFHGLELLVSLLFPAILQPKIVHENTWVNAMTYHWDFTRADYRRMAGAAGLTDVRIYSQGFFFPRTLLRSPDAYAAKERVFRRLPLLRLFGDDLVLVARKK